MTVLVTGGAGFIGSHTVVELLSSGYDVIVVDNYSNSKPCVNDRVRKITGRDFKVFECEMCDAAALDAVFDENHIDAVIHFAAFKAVGESVRFPLKYYRNNISGTVSLCEIMNEFGCKRIVFSSSATVYGSPKSVPIREDFPLSTTNPYGSTKLMMEMILSDVAKADPEWSVILLRYFNPIGAHESGLIGEMPNGIPNNLMPYIAQVGAGQLDHLNVFGNDYPTRDGTGVRDYIHVVDLAKGHIKAIEKAMKSDGVNIYNLGTGNGYSVLEIVHAFEKVNGIPIPYEIKPRRDGDIAECYADPTKAFNELGWKAELGIEEMCRSSWEFTRRFFGK